MEQKLLECEAFNLGKKRAQGRCLELRDSFNQIKEYQRFGTFRKTSRESQNAALRTPYRFSMRQVVFTIIVQYYYHRYYYRQVLSPFKFLSFVTIWVSKFLSQFQILNLVTIWVFELSQVEFLSVVTIWDFEFCHNFNF